MKFFPVFILLSFLAMSSCSTVNKGIFTSKKNNNDIRASTAMKGFVRGNPNATVIVSELVNRYTRGYEDLELMSEIYEIMENELSAAGFQVKDRTAYNKVLMKSKNYEQIEELEGIDIVIQLTDLTVDASYLIDRYQKDRTAEMVKLKNGKLKVSGASMSFGAVMVKNSKGMNNRLQYHYAPCLEGCEFYMGPNEYIYRGKNNSNAEVNVNGVIQREILLHFIEESTRKMIVYLKK